MEMTLMQIRQELAYMAQQHEQINGFFWGDFLDAVNNAQSAQYPLMTCTLQNSSMANNSVTVRLVIAVFDKYFEGNHENIDNIHSDCLRILGDIKTTLKQERFADYLDVEPQISTEPFVNRTQDVTAGWAMTISLNVYDAENWCEIPYTFYDFENGTFPVPECEPVTVTDGAQTIEIPSGGAYVCQSGGSPSDITVSNSNDTYVVTTSTDLELPNTTVKIFLDGVFQEDVVIPTLDPSNSLTITLL
jgi:hypothetical protein